MYEIIERGVNRSGGWVTILLLLLVLAACSFGGGVLLYLLGVKILLPLRDISEAALLAAGPPLILSLLVLAVFVAVGLLRGCLNEDVREWWASLCGGLMLYAVGWLSAFSLAFFGPDLVLWLGHTPAVLVGVAAVWVAMTAYGLLAGHNSPTANGKAPWREWLALAAPHVFLAGLLVLGSLLLHVLLYGQGADVLEKVVRSSWATNLAGATGCFAAFLLFAGRVDVNLFSLRALYGNRLIRCFLGASRPKPPGVTDRLLRGAPTNSRATPREPHATTGFDPDDDLPLHALLIGAPPAPDERGNRIEPADAYCGPYLLINTALNLVEDD